MDKETNFIVFERLFWQLSKKVEYVWKDIYQQTFPGSQSHIMFLLQQNGSRKMSELSEALHITAGAVTTASDHLIEDGYLARIRDKEDRRVVRLELTEKGTATLMELQNEGRKIMKVVFNDLSSTELEMLTTIFKQANLNIEHLTDKN